MAQFNVEEIEDVQIIEKGIVEGDSQGDSKDGDTDGVDVKKVVKFQDEEVKSIDTADQLVKEQNNEVIEENKEPQKSLDILGQAQEEIKSDEVKPKANFPIVVKTNKFTVESNTEEVKTETPQPSCSTPSKSTPPTASASSVPQNPSAPQDIKAVINLIDTNEESKGDSQINEDSKIDENVTDRSYETTEPSDQYSSDEEPYNLKSDLEAFERDGS